MSPATPYVDEYGDCDTGEVVPYADDPDPEDEDDR